MSKPYQVIDLSQNNHEQVILRRLLCCALYDYVKVNTPINYNNLINMRRFLQVLLPDYSVEHIVNWLLDTNNEPTRFELLLLFNQQKLSTQFMRKHLKTGITHPKHYLHRAEIKSLTLDEGTLHTIYMSLCRIYHTVFDFTIFDKIKWDFNLIHETGAQ